ncbi:MAG: hypothetical protein ABJD97_14365 [Betaproteobacteria bacterium]
MPHCLADELQRWQVLHGILVRSARRSDGPAVATVASQAWPTPTGWADEPDKLMHYGPASPFLAGDGNAFGLVACDRDGVLLGHAFALERADGLYLAELARRPAAANPAPLGIGAALFAATVARALARGTLGAGVCANLALVFLLQPSRAATRRAIVALMAYYRSFGFEPSDVGERVLSDGQPQPASDLWLHAPARAVCAALDGQLAQHLSSNASRRDGGLAEATVSRHPVDGPPGTHAPSPQASCRASRLKVGS